MSKSKSSYKKRKSISEPEENLSDEEHDAPTHKRQKGKDCERSQPNKSTNKVKKKRISECDAGSDSSCSASSSTSSSSSASSSSSSTSSSSSSSASPAAAVPNDKHSSKVEKKTSNVDTADVNPLKEKSHKNNIIKSKTEKGSSQTNRSKWDSPELRRRGYSRSSSRHRERVVRSYGLADDRSRDDRRNNYRNDNDRSRSRQRELSWDHVRSREFDRKERSNNRYDRRRSNHDERNKTKDRYRENQRYGNDRGNNGRQRGQRDSKNRRSPRREQSSEYRIKREQSSKERSRPPVQQRNCRISYDRDDRSYEWGKNTDGKSRETAKPIEKEKPNFGLSGALTEDTNKVNGIVIKYAEPPEARKPKRRWRLYPFKGETSLPTLHIHRQSCFLVGRERKVVDLAVDHPSCSKQHAALQYRLVPFQREDGSHGKRVRLYLIDLDSANGTFLNNNKVDARKYYELIERDVIKFGFSTREYVLLHENSKEDQEDDDVEVKQESEPEALVA